MRNLINFLVLLLLLCPLYKANSSDFERALDTIDVRKTAMQELWHRIKRLSPYVELKETIDYNKELAVEDAQEVVLLLEKTKNLWNSNSNLSAKGFTNATPAVWALPEYFSKLYKSANNAADNLKLSIIDDDIEGTLEAMCSLGNSCGTCHANFRRLLTSQLSNEVSGWSGKYIRNCE